MKTYKSIPSTYNIDKIKGPLYIFNKYDGSNIRAEWSKKQGWYKFGTRHQLMDHNTPIFGSAIDLFLNKYGDSVPTAICELYKKTERFTVYAEWFGAESFAGQHKPDDPKNIIIFDINLHKQGMISPRDFIRLYKYFDIAKGFGTYAFDEDMMESIRKEERWVDMFVSAPIRNKIFEGVICKHGEGHNLKMFKIKTYKYKEMLKETLGDDWTKYW